ncbi:MAG TPA: hypothetical protein VI172_01795 [Candidatus Dormibacteraeota bacterium]|jgi:hypothetical protein
MARVQRFGPGEEADEMSPGDFILAHRHHVLAGLISLAQKRRFHGPDAAYAHWSHCAVVESSGRLIEAEINGIVRSPISKYRKDEYHLVRMDGEIAASGRQHAAAYARTRLGEGFGFLDMFGLSLYLMVGRRVRLVHGDHEICSSFVVRCLQHAGLLRELDPALTLPADLAKRFDVHES